MIYQNTNVTKPLIESLNKVKPEGSKVIWRDAFRWHDSNGVLSNHYESFSLDTIARDFNYEVIYNFNHVAVVRKRLADSSTETMESENE